MPTSGLPKPEIPIYRNLALSLTMCPLSPVRAVGVTEELDVAIVAWFNGVFLGWKVYRDRKFGFMVDIMLISSLSVMYSALCMYSIIIKMYIHQHASSKSSRQKSTL